MSTARKCEPHACPCDHGHDYGRQTRKMRCDGRNRMACTAALDPTFSCSGPCFSPSPLFPVRTGASWMVMLGWEHTISLPKHAVGT
eukprot:365248-Chlamydomonas_euryale.AAC.5